MDHAFLFAAMTHAPLAGQIISDAVNTVSGGNLNPALATGTGAAMLSNLAINLVGAIRTLIAVIALFTFTRAGIKLINSADEDKLGKAKKTMAASVVGVMLAYLVVPLTKAFYGTTVAVATEGGTVLETAGGVAIGSAVLTAEVVGVINWVATVVPAMGILIIVVSALRGIATFGDENAVKTMRQSVLGVAMGLVLLMSTDAIMAALGLGLYAVPGTPVVAALFARGLSVVSALLVYLQLGAAAMAVYAGMLMILNVGNDDQYSKAKGILTRTAIGLGIIFAAWALVQLVTFLVLG